MSTTIDVPHNGRTYHVTRYCGPETDDEDTRMRIQIEDLHLPIAAACKIALAVLELGIDWGRRDSRLEAHAVWQTHLLERLERALTGEE